MLPPTRTTPPIVTRFRRLRAWWPAVLLLWTSGCFQYQEEVWIYEDHSGRMEGQVRVPTDIWQAALRGRAVRPDELREHCERVARRVEGVELVSYKEISTSEYQRVYWAFSFTDHVALTGLYRDGTDQALALLPEEQTEYAFEVPDASVDRLGRLTTVDRHIPSMSYALVNADWAVTLAGHQARFQLHAPEPIIGAGDFTLSPDRRTATRELPLRTLFERGMDMRLSFRRPFPLGPILGSLFGVLAAVCGIWGLAYMHMARGLPPPEEPAYTDAPAMGSDDSWKDSSGEFSTSLPPVDEE